MTPTLSTQDKIRELNDAFRTGDILAGQWMITRGVASLGPEFVALAMWAVRRADTFSAANDPYGEHDFGAFTVLGEGLYWKIDYYDRTLGYGSHNPADPSVTTRVLTVMLASEY